MLAVRRLEAHVRNVKLLAVTIALLVTAGPLDAPCQETHPSSAKLLWQAENPSCFNPDASLKEKLESLPKFVVEGDITEPKKVAGRNWSEEDLAALATLKVQVRPVIEMVIGPDGSVELVAAVREEPSEADRRLAAAVSEWQFEPATLNGEPICITYIMTSTICY